MVGVCLTVISLLQAIFNLNQLNSFADDLLALDALFFLCACLLSYWSLRLRHTRRMVTLERLADGIFILGLLLMVVVCALITYGLI